MTSEATAAPVRDDALRQEQKPGTPPAKPQEFGSYSFTITARFMPVWTGKAK